METSEKQNTTIDVSQEEESANNNHAIKGRAIDLAASGEYAKQKLRDTLIDSIPVDFVKALPSKYSLSAGVFVICLQMAIFLYFTISGYLADQSAFFISLDKSSGICVEVPRAGTALALYLFTLFFISLMSYSVGNVHVYLWGSVAGV